jgi:hypothetical protein
MICLNQSKGKPFFLVQLWQKIILCFFLRWIVLGCPRKRIVLALWRPLHTVLLLNCDVVVASTLYLVEISMIHTT